jgi:mannosyltransferase OCH1-like enzyme
MWNTRDNIYIRNLENNNFQFSNNCYNNNQYSVINVQRFKTKYEIQKERFEKIQNIKNIIENYKKKRKEEQENMLLNRTFVLKSKYESVIPLFIYTAWHKKNLKPKMRENLEKLKRDNPEFEVKLFDNNDCEEFIKNNFDESVLNAYKSLIPHAYKCDLWRYCIMYLNGGIYLDIKFNCVNGFKLIGLTEKDYWTSDHLFKNTLNGLLILKPKNDIMLKCINKVVENVKNKFYGEGCLHPTGPQMLGEFFTNSEKINMETNLLVKSNNICVTYRGSNILCYYNDYDDEREKDSPNLHYSILWKNKNIYKNIKNDEI